MIPIDRARAERAADPRPDVTAVIERALDREDSAIRLYPDLYAQRVTQALIKAGIVPPSR